MTIRTIEQTVEFAGTTGRELFDIYVDSARHGQAIGADAAVGQAPGGEFSAFGGGLRGRLYALVPGRMVVQSWRAQTWQPDDLDSVLTLTFSDTPEGGRIRLVQAGVPEHTYEVISDGWERRYWVHGASTCAGRPFSAAPGARRRRRSARRRRRGSG